MLKKSFLFILMWLALCVITVLCLVFEHFVLGCCIILLVACISTVLWSIVSMWVDLGK